MPDPKIPLKDPWLAALLAFLLPGAGHLYQGRTFKGVLYLVCILGTFFYGLHLGDWRVVYFHREPGKTTYGYFAQVLVGLPALPALIQAKRYHDPSNQRLTTLDAPLEAQFNGFMEQQTNAGNVNKDRVSGRIRLEPAEGQFGPEVHGSFTGIIRKEDGKEEPVELALTGLELEKKVFADSQRTLTADVVGQREGEEQVVGQVIGVIPRHVWNWYAVPLEDKTLQALNGRLGKFYELALVFTWIAGLLNILAIWDAGQGPAYGYRDERHQPEQKTTSSSKSDAAPAKPHTTPDANSPAPADDKSRDETPAVEHASQPPIESRWDADGREK